MKLKLLKRSDMKANKIAFLVSMTILFNSLITLSIVKINNDMQKKEFDRKVKTEIRKSILIRQLNKNNTQK